MKYLVVFFIALYQVTISPLLHAIIGNSSGCRYQPTCSEYAKKVIMQYGLTKGTVMALKRLVTCHPFARV